MSINFSTAACKITLPKFPMRIIITICIIKLLFLHSSIWNATSQINVSLELQLFVQNFAFVAEHEGRQSL